MLLRRKCSISLLHNADNVQLLDRSWMGAGVLPLLIRVDCKAFCTVLQINALEKKAETVALCVHVCERVPCHTFELLHATFRPQSHSCRSCAIHQTRDNRPPTQQITGTPSASRAEQNIHGPWQIAATGRPAATNDETISSIFLLRLI